MSDFHCSICGCEFDSKRGLGVHKSTGHGSPWQDKDTLEEMYYDDNMSISKISDHFGCSEKAIINSMDNYGIELRSKSEAAKIGCAKDDEKHQCPHDDCERVFNGEKALSQHKFHSHGANSLEKSEFIDLYINGEHTQEEIADMYDMANSRVCQKVKECGFKY